MCGMKTFLRNSRTGLYIKSAASWTTVQEEALNFTDIENALEFVVTFKLSGLHLDVLLFNDPQLTTLIGLEQFITAALGMSCESGDEGPRARPCKPLVASRMI
jgi:hypothetical protein